MKFLENYSTHSQKRMLEDKRSKTIKTYDEKIASSVEKTEDLRAEKKEKKEQIDKQLTPMNKRIQLG